MIKLLFILLLPLLSLTTPVKETAKVVRGVSKNLRPYFATYYLSGSGSDGGSGAIGAPWATLEHAWIVLAPGDRLYCRDNGGPIEFDDMQYLDGLDGTSGNRIEIWAYPGETPVFTESSSYVVQTGVDQDLIYLEGNWFHFKGIEISNFEQREGENAWPAFRAGFTSNSIFEQINYTGNAAGFSIRGNSTNNLILNSDFSRNQDPYSGTPYDGADGLDLHFITATTGTNTVDGCRFWWNTDDGLDLWECDTYVLVKNCWSFWNGYLPGTFIEAGNGSGFKLGPTGDFTSTLKRTVQNCLAYRNKDFGFVENAADCQMNIHNNTAVLSGIYNYWFGVWPGLETTVATLVNNVGDQGANDLADQVIETTNSWQGFTITTSDVLSIDENVLDRSRNADGSKPDIFLYHLAPGSDLVRGGTEVGLGTDLGFFGYQGRFSPMPTGQINGKNIQILQQ